MGTEASVTHAVPDWVADLLTMVDAGDVDGVVSRLAHDVTFRVGNASPMIGHDEVRDGLAHLLASVATMEHHVIEVWEADEDCILVADVDYTRLRGDVVTIPAVTRIHRRAELVDRLQIFHDVSPALPASS